MPTTGAILSIYEFVFNMWPNSHRLWNKGGLTLSARYIFETCSKTVCKLGSQNTSGMFGLNISQRF